MGYIHTIKDLTISSVIKNWGQLQTQSTALVKDGQGALTLTAANTYAGGTYLDSGTLVVGASSGAPGISAVMLNGGTLTSSLASVTIPAIIAGVGPQTIVRPLVALLEASARSPPPAN